MFCSKCGNEFADDAGKCPSCNEATRSAVVAKPKVWVPKFFVIILAAIVFLGAICLVLFLGGGNYVTVTFDSVANVSKLSSFDFSISVEGKNEEMLLDGSLVLGKDLKESILDVTIESKGSSSWNSYEEKTRVVFNENKLALSELYYGDEYYSYEEDVIEGAEKYLNNLIGKKINLNSFVKNKHWDIEKINETMMKYMALSGDEITTDVLQDFLGKECKKKSVWSSFISDGKKKVGLKTEYTYTIEVDDFIEELGGYLRKVQKSGSSKKKEEAKYWEEMLEEMGGVLGKKADVTLVVGAGKKLHSLSIKTHVGNENININIEISNHNKAKADGDDITKFFDAAEEYNDTWGY